MSRKWIQEAIKRPGQLKRDLGIPQDQKIPRKLLDKAAEGAYGKATQRRAVLAKTLRRMG